MSLSTVTGVTMLDTRAGSGALILPLTTANPYRVLTVKDIYGAAAASSITLTTQGTDVFENGLTSMTLTGAYDTTTLYAGQAGYWYVIGGSRMNSAAIGLLSTGTIINPLRLGTISTQTAIQFAGLNTNYTGTVVAEQTTGVGTQELLLYKASSISDQIRLQTTGNIVFEAGAPARSWPSSAPLATPTLYIAGASSNVGIGTAAPATTLDVAGTIRATTLSTLGFNVSSINGQSLDQFGTAPLYSSIIGLGSVGYVSTQALQQTSNYFKNTTLYDVSTSITSATSFTSNTSNYFKNTTAFDTSTSISTVATFTSNTSNYFKNTTAFDTSTSISTVATFTSNTSNYFQNSLLYNVSSATLTNSQYTSNTSNYFQNLLAYNISSSVSTATLFTSNTSNFILSTFQSSISTVVITALTGFISSLTVNALAIGSNVGFISMGDLITTSLSTLAIQTGQATITQATISSLNGDVPLTLLNMTSTVVGMNSNISSMIDPVELTSSIVGLGTIGFTSTIGLTYIMNSTVMGIATNNASTVTGLTSNISSMIDPVELTSTIVGLGTFGFISSIGFDAKFRSTVDGLGTAGYISSSQLYSTVTGIGSGFTGSTIGLSAGTITVSTIKAYYLSTSFAYISSLQVDTLNVGGAAGYVNIQDLIVSTVSAGQITAAQSFFSSLQVNTISFGSGSNVILPNILATSVSTIQVNTNSAYVNNLYIGNNSTQSALLFPGINNSYKNSAVAEQNTGIGTQELLFFRGSSISDQIRLQTTGNIVFETGVSARTWSTNTMAATPTLYIAGTTSNVGIGTNAPGATLDVVGTARALTFSTLLLNVSSVNANYAYASTVKTNLLNASTALLTYNGSAAPTSFGVGSDTLTLQAANAYAGGVASMAFTTATSGYPLARIYAVDASASGAATSQLVFQTAPASSTSFSSNFTYTGATTNLTVPAGVTSLSVQMWGAGAGTPYNGDTGWGGAGAYLTGIITVTPGQVLTLLVGGGGVGNPSGNGGAGGFGGGGTSSSAGGGGGRSAVQKNFSLQPSVITITGASAVSSNVTYTTSGSHGLIVGQPITISGLSPSASFNGSYAVTSVATSNTFTIVNSNASTGSSTGTGNIIAELVIVGGGGGPGKGANSDYGGNGTYVGAGANGQGVHGTSGGGPQYNAATPQVGGSSGGGGVGGVLTGASGPTGGGGGYYGGGAGGNGTGVWASGGGGSSYYSLLTSPTGSNSANFYSPPATGVAGYQTGVAAGASSAGVSGGNGQIIIATVGNALAEAMRIATNGNVGIGTTTPAALLDVAGLARATSMSTFALNVSSINGADVFQQAYLTSTLGGLGNVGYISTSQLTSTVQGITVTGYITGTQTTSSLQGLATFGFISTSQLTSTIRGLGSAGYISSSQLFSTVLGIGSGFTGSTVSLSAGTIFVSSIVTNSAQVSTLAFSDTTTRGSNLVTQSNSILYYNLFPIGGVVAWIGQLIIPPGPPLTSIYSYTGGSQTWTVPAGLTSINAYMWAAGGGGGVTVSGGAGAFVQAAVPVTPGETLTFIVGGGGGLSASASAYGGGGVGGGGSFGTGGGGRVAIQRGSVGASDYIVVGAGGGASKYGSAGIGGAGGIAAGTAAVGTTGLEGKGGTQSAGGAGTSGVISSGAAGTLATGGNAGAYGGGGGAGYYGGGGAGATSGVGASGGGGSSFVDNSLPISLVVSSDGVSAPNSSSQYYVATVGAGATASGGTGGNGLIVITYTLAPPLPPTGLTLTLSGTTATLSWSASASGASLYYWAFYGNSTSAYTGTYLMSGSTAATSVSYSVSVTYFDYFRLVSLSPLGCISQIVSSPILNVPAPSGLSISANGTTVTLSWSAVSGATGYAYTLYSNTIYAYGGSSVTTGSVAGTTFTYNSGVSGTYYYFTVNATTGYGTSLLNTSGIVQDVDVLYTSSTVTVSTFPATSLTSFGIGLAVNSSGNLLVATNFLNSSNYSYLNLITYPSGTVTLLAGNGLGGLTSGTGTSVPLGIVQNIAFNASTSILYLTDQANAAIRTYTPSTYTANSGTVATLSSSGFTGPEGIALLQDGNFVVADRGSNQIKVITPSGTVSVLAGSGASGLSNATGTSATFNWPTSVTVASDGKILVADRNNNVVRLVTYPGGVVTTFAGNSSGTSGSSDGTGTGASFYGPNGLGVLPNGNIILADRFNQTVRMMTYPGAVVTTLAGIQGSSGFVNGVGSSAKFADPWSIAVSPYTGCIFVGDFYNGTVRLITPGTFSPPTNLAITPADGNTATISWTASSGATGYNWVLYRSSTNGYFGTSVSTGSTSSTVYTATVTGLNYNYYYYFTVIATGSTNSAAAVSAIMYELPDAPSSLSCTTTGTTVNMSWGTTSGATAYTYTVYQASLYAYSGTIVATAVNGTSTSASYTGVAGNYYYFTVSVTTANGTSALSTSGIAQAQVGVVLYTSANAVVTTFAGSGTGQYADGTGTGASFHYPRCAALSTDGNTLYVTDGYTGSGARVRMITTAGAVVTSLAGNSSFAWVDGTGTGASFNAVWGISLIPSSGNLVVSDGNGSHIRMVTPAGVVTTLAGSATLATNDGTGAGAGFFYPREVAVAPTGQIIVAGYGDTCIRVITTATYASNSGVVVTLAGNRSFQSYADGTGSSAYFNIATGVTMLTDGNIAVTDYANNRMRVIAPGTYAANSGVVTTLAGQTATGSNDATGAAASFSGPIAAVGLPNGNLIVSDTGNHRIRYVTYPGGVVTTLAGNTQGSNDGTGTAATFYNPGGLISSADGTKIYLCDTWNHRIRLITFPKLSAPTNPILVTSGGSATLSWTAASAATGYSWNLYQSSTNNYAGTSYSTGTTATTSPSVQPTGLPLNYYYYFTVIATASGGSSPAAASAIVQELITGPATATLTGIAGTTMNLSWGSVSGATSYTYTLYSGSSYNYNTMSFVISASTASTSTTYSGTTGLYYYFTVTATTATGTSLPTTSGIVQIVSSPPTYVSSFTYTGANQTLPFGALTTTNVYMWGAGGGGGYGGGAGAYLSGILTLLTNASSYTVIVGQGGSSGNPFPSSYGGGGGDGASGTGSGGGRSAIQATLTCVPSITSANGTTATVTTSAAHGLVVGQPIILSNLTPSGYNGAYAVATVPTTTSFTIATTQTGTSSGTGVLVAELVDVGGGGAGGGWGPSTGGFATYSGTAGAGSQTNAYGGYGTGGSQTAGGIGGTSQNLYAGSNGTILQGGAGGAGGGGGYYGGGGGGGGNSYAAWSGGGGSSYSSLLTSIVGSNTPNVASAPATGSPYYTGSVATGSTGTGGNGLVAATIPVSAPTSLTISITSGTATLGWTGASGATGYSWTLYQSATSNYNGASAATGTTATTSPTSAPSGLSSGKFWYFTVASTASSLSSSVVASSIYSY